MMHDDSGESVEIEEGSNGQQSNGFIGGGLQTIGQQAINGQQNNNGQLSRNGQLNSGYRSGPNVGRGGIRRQNRYRNSNDEPTIMHDDSGESVEIEEGSNGVQNHCPNSQTRRKCVKGPGPIWANTNP